MKPRIYCLFFLSCAVFFCGCPIASKSPISSPKDSAADTRLAGKWSAISLTITPGRSPWMHAEEYDRTTSGQLAKYDFFPTVIGKYRFLNVQPYEQKNGRYYKMKGTYYLMRYEISENGTLTLWTIPNAKAAQIIRSGKLKGHVGKGDSDVYFADTSENIRNFIQHADIEALFSEKTDHIYQKLR